MIDLLIIREKAPRPPEYHGMAARVFASTSHRRQDLIPWYTSGFQ